MRYRLGLLYLWVGVGCLTVGCADDGSGVGPGASSAGPGSGDDGSTGDSGTSGASMSGGTSGTDTASGGSHSGDTGSATTSTDTGGTGTTGGDSLTLDCNSPALGAIDANYGHDFVVMGDMGAMLSWQATGLPDGLGINPVTGRITGQPTASGMFSAEITVSGPGGAQDMQTCEFEINPALSFDLGTLDPPCIDETMDPNDYVVGGDGSGLKCRKLPGRGNGKLPAGITVNEDTCLIEGTNTAAFGLIAWMIEVEQAGAKAFVPYCMAQPNQAPGAYAITVEHGAAPATLKPWVGTFNVGAAPMTGSNVDPHFEITGGCAPNACWYNFRWSANASGFDVQLNGTTLNPNGRIANAGGEGFEHHFQASGPWDSNGDGMIDATDQAAFDSRFAGRAWVQNLHIDYCLKQQQGMCSDPATDGNGELEFSVIMFPG